MFYDNWYLYVTTIFLNNCHILNMAYFSRSGAAKLWHSCQSHTPQNNTFCTVLIEVLNRDKMTTYVNLNKLNLSKIDGLEIGEFLSQLNSNMRSKNVSDIRFWNYHIRIKNYGDKRAPTENLIPELHKETGLCYFNYFWEVYVR